jgi:Kdo2-lipid IVA lauroyltransferase/acyltransferase
MSRKRLKWTHRDWARRYFVWPLQGAAFIVIISLLAALPPRPAASFGSALGGFLGPRLSRQHARAIGRNLAIAFPNITEADSTALQRRILAHFGRVLSSYSHLPLLLRRSDFSEVVDVEGADHLAEVASAGAFLLVGAHFGHWELPGCYAAVSGCPMSGLYTPESNPWIDRAFLRLRRKADAQAVLIPRGPAAVRKMMEALRDRRGLFILMDHRVDDGEWLPFFGRPAQTATTPARLARRFGCPILLGRAILLSKNRYKISFYEPLRPAPSEDKSTDILRMTCAINTAFESWIREDPAQWLCTTRRWPKRREGQLSQAATRVAGSS